MKKPVIALLAVILAFSCNRYNRLLKSSDTELKYEWAMKFYTDQEYNKAFPLMEEIIPLYRGSAKSEELNYRYAYCNYYLSDFYMAGERFRMFYNIFPTSKYAEDCMFMAAYCHYLNSPRYSLDQTSTKEALDGFDKFRNTYPTSPLYDSSVTLTNTLKAKLEKKAYESARLYFTTENYKASIVALHNFLKEYPDSKYSREANFLVLKSSYLLAMNSVIKKKEERINDTIDAYYNFVDNFGDEKYRKEAEEMYDEIIQERDKLLKVENN